MSVGASEVGFGRSARSLSQGDGGRRQGPRGIARTKNHPQFGDSTRSSAGSRDGSGRIEIFLPGAAASALKAALATAGVAAGGTDTWEIARVESGRPQWGADMDDSTLPQEANLDELGAISYTKGCYIGQETVARVHFRGHVNRFLRRLRFVTRPAPPKGAELVDETGKVWRSPQLALCPYGCVRWGW